MLFNVLAAGLSLFAIYWVFLPLSAQVYRPAFLAVALLLTFMVFRASGTSGHPEENPTPWTGRSGSPRSWRSATPR